MLTKKYWMPYLLFDMQLQKAEPSQTEVTHSDPRAPKPACRVLRSADLLGPDGRLLIEHEGQVYVLQRTKAGKLILTK